MDYEVSIKKLSEIGGELESFSNDLTGLQESFNSILAGFPIGLDEMRRRISVTGASVSEITLASKRLRTTLADIADVYALAERDAMGSADNKTIAPKTQLSTPKIVDTKNSVMLTGSIVMPHWLQVAVLKYEQSQTG